MGRKSKMPDQVRCRWLAGHGGLPDIKTSVVGRIHVGRNHASAAFNSAPKMADQVHAAHLSVHMIDGEDLKLAISLIRKDGRGRVSMP